MAAICPLLTAESALAQCGRRWVQQPAELSSTLLSTTSNPRTAGPAGPAARASDDPAAAAGVVVLAAVVVFLVSVVLVAAGVEIFAEAPAPADLLSTGPCPTLLDDSCWNSTKVTYPGVKGTLRVVEMKVCTSNTGLASALLARAISHRSFQGCDVGAEV